MFVQLTRSKPIKLDANQKRNDNTQICPTRYVSMNWDSVFNDNESGL